jgi:hypothetical protein
MTTSTTSTTPATSPPLPLPQIKGPKLEPFRGTANVDLEFVRYIGSEDDVDSKVWKVRVDDKYYALKIVSQRRPSYPLPGTASFSIATDSAFF